MGFKTIEWKNQQLILIDQTKLPLIVEYITYTDHKKVASAIVDMVVRGAPAIGVTAAFGLVLAAYEFVEKGGDFKSQMEEAFELFASTRPTAVNLFWAIERMRDLLNKMEGKTPLEIADALEKDAIIIRNDDVESCRKMGLNGAKLLPDEVSILTHCNAGALATADYGTALGVIRSAVELGKKVKVYADETRPFLQGARLTAWELMMDKIDVTLICDNMAGHLMKLGKVDVVVVGADRIAANGDAANKIGTYPLSIVAKAHKVPFYVAAPTTTVDLTLAHGGLIPIEERPIEEVTGVGGARVAPFNVKVWNPAFDVTPAANIEAIFLDTGVARAPYGEAFKTLVKGKQ
jgi:methylthioribose-1-phosphate isomerase